MSKEVKLTLHCDDSVALTAVGFMYAGDPPADDPKSGGVSIRDTRYVVYDLDPGDYNWRFKVQNGSGGFTLKAIGEDEDVLKSTDYKTDDGVVHLLFKFTV